jgi:tetratricopeptide (TPR) repeat protein
VASHSDPALVASSDGRPRLLWWAVLLVALTIVAYIPALGAGWIWDDDSYVTHNALLAHDLPFQEALRLIWTPGNTPQYYPIVFTSFLLESRLYGSDFTSAPFGFHLVNVLLHATSALLLWTILRRLSVPGAWLAAAIFALHPMNVESVAWVTERKNVLALALGLGSIWAWLAATPPKDDATPARPPHYGMCALSLVLFVFAMLSKTTISAVAPAIVLLHLWRRDRLAAGQWAFLAAFFAIGIPLGLHTAHVERTHVGAEGEEFLMTFAQRLALAPTSALFYVWTFVWPSRLAFIYPRWTIDAANAVTWIPFAVVTASLGAGAFLWTRGSRGPLVLMLLVLAGVFPALGFFDVYPFRYSFVADHFAYLATVPLAVAAAWIIVALTRRFAPKVRATVAGALLLVSTLLTATQTLGYADEETLWRASLTANPNAWMPWTNLAGVLLPKAGRQLDAGNTEKGLALAREAAEAAQRSIDIDPTNATAWTNLSEALRLETRFADAIKAADKAVEIAPQLAHVHWRQGRLRELLGDFAGAAESFRKSIELPDRTRAPVQIGPILRERRMDLARVLGKADRIAETAPIYEALLAENPADAEAAANLARAEQRLGNVEKARTAYRVALTNAPEPRFAVMIMPGFVDALLAAPVTKESAAEAVDAARWLQQRVGDDPLALVLLARAQAAHGERDAARASIAKAREKAAAAPQQVKDEIERRAKELEPPAPATP